MLAVITTGPEVAPAVAVTCARPCALVVAVDALRVAGPLVTAKFTVAPGTGAALSFTCTISGLAKAVPSLAVWPLPETVCRAVMTEFTLTVKTTFTELLLAKATVTCTGRGVVLIKAKPGPWGVEGARGLGGGAPPAVTDHVTGAWLDGSPPRSVTSATNADVASTPGLTFWLLPAMIFMIAGGPELTVNAVPPKFTKLPPTTIAYAPEPSWLPNTGVQVAIPVESVRTVPGCWPGWVAQFTLGWPAAQGSPAGWPGLPVTQG